MEYINGVKSLYDMYVATKNVFAIIKEYAQDIFATIYHMRADMKARFESN